jgi:putative spermidine/putrescine transport system ATP-binding protein
LPLKGVRRENGATVGQCEGRPIRLNGQAAEASGEALFAIRPEYMSLAAKPDAAANSISATAVSRTYLGSATKLDLATPAGTKLTLSVPNDVAAAALSGSDSVWLNWPADKGFLLTGNEA